MKKVINSLLYDTSTAYLVNEHVHCNYMFVDCNETTLALYLTKNGRFFLYKHTSELFWLSYNYFSKIIPLTNKQAYQYMEKYCPEKISKIFNIKEA